MILEKISGFLALISLTRTKTEQRSNTGCGIPSYLSLMLLFLAVLITFRLEKCNTLLEFNLMGVYMLSHFRILSLSLPQNKVQKCVHLVELNGTGEYFAMKAMDKGIMLNRNKEAMGQWVAYLGVLQNFLDRIGSHFLLQEVFISVRAMTFQEVLIGSFLQEFRSWESAWAIEAMYANKLAVKVIEQVYSVHPKYDNIVSALLSDGVLKLPDTFTFVPGVPIGPILAKPTKGVSEILDKF